MLSVIKHEKYLNCNILVTCRPHSTRDIKEHFDTVVSVQGFTQIEARKFASCVVRDDDIARQILDFNPTGNQQEATLCNSPILLSFMCRLVIESAVDLTKKTMPTGEIYTRMVQCLYKQFTIRRGIRYNVNKFAEVVGVVGNEAWDTLFSNNALFEKSRVHREVGEDAFHYGFLIGDQDLIGDIIGDINVTFLHRNIQEFFGTFFFVLLLNQGMVADCLQGADVKTPIFMVNPLVLHFCFWFLNDHCEREYFNFGNKETARKVLCREIFKHIRGRQLDLRQLAELYPAIDIPGSNNTNDQINAEHFGRILEMFDDLRYLTLRHDDHVDWILNHILSNYDTLTLVVVEDDTDQSQHNVFLQLSKAKGNDLNIVLSGKACRVELFKCLVKRGARWKRQSFVYLLPADGTTIDPSQFLYVKMHKLHIISMSSESSLVTANSEFDSCPSLTHLSIKGCVSVDQSAMLAISKAVRDGKLPSLDSLSFAGANISGQLKHLFDEHTEWPVLSHLNLLNSELDIQDLRDLFTDANGLLTKLASLELSDSHSYHTPDEDIFSTQYLENLTALSLTSLTKSGFSKMTEAIRQSMLVNLRKLFLCMGRAETCRLEDIEPKQIPRIEDLCLQRCVASVVDLKRLSHLASHWKLCCLDISYSRGIDEHLSSLTSSQDLKSLKSLVLRDCDLGEQALASLEQANEEGRLSNLETLDLSENPDSISCIDKISSRWNNLQRLRIDHKTSIFLTKNGFDVLRPLLEKDCKRV